MNVIGDNLIAAVPLVPYFLRLHRFLFPAPTKLVGAAMSLGSHLLMLYSFILKFAELVLQAFLPFESETGFVGM
ncbi:hypothetical protein EV2_047906 [Malus domestica]